jgi:hypothetical protein
MTIIRFSVKLTKNIASSILFITLTMQEET